MDHNQALIVYTTHYDMQVHRFDVKCAFIYEELDDMYLGVQLFVKVQDYMFVKMY